MNYLGKLPVENFSVPSNIVTQDVDVVSGYKAHDGFPARIEYFVKGTVPEEEDPVHLKMKVCKSSGKIATVVDIARGEYDEKEYVVLKESDPTAAENGPNKWQEAIDRWVSQQADSKYHPPTELCESQNQIEVIINEPQDHVQLGNSFRMKIDPISLNEIIKVEIFVDGSLKETVTTSPFERDLNLQNGAYTLKVRAQDIKGNVGEREIKIGVNVPWDYTSPTPTPIPSPTLTIAPTITPTL